MARHLFIVSRRHPRLYEYLVDRFAGDKDVWVILDRRHRDRRVVGRPDMSPRDGDRRFHDRRQRPAVDAELLTGSHAIISFSD